VSVVVEGEMDLEKVNTWLGLMLEVRGDDLYRLKGILAIHGCEERFVFQGVHQLFEGMPAGPWAAGEARHCRMVFIGKGLVREDLEAGVQSCLA